MRFESFELEQAILNAWTGNDDLDLLLKAFDDGASEDEILNLIVGIKALQQKKFEKIWDLFEAGVNQKRIV